MYKDKNICEDCKWYGMIDSGYGYCLRFPPKDVIKSRFPRLKIDIEYQIVPWTMRVCGEFSSKEVI